MSSQEEDTRRARQREMKEAAASMRQFARWLKKEGLLTKADGDKPLEELSLGQYYEKHWTDYVLSRPDDGSLELRRMLVEVDGYLGEEIRKLRQFDLETVSPDLSSEDIKKIRDQKRTLEEAKKKRARVEAKFEKNQ